MKNNSDKLSLVFDLGGVLIEWNPRHLYRKLFPGDPERMEWFLSNICTQDWNVKQDAGRLFSEAVLELVELYPEHEALIRAFDERWDEMVPGAIEPTVDILRVLREDNYNLYALSNWSVEKFAPIPSRFEFLGLFDKIIISGDVKVAKPDPRIFSILLERTERIAEECLFIDDSPMNVAAAEQLGFKTIHFQSPEQLRNELLRMDILKQPQRHKEF